MAVDRVSSGKRQRRMIFFAQRRKGAKKVGLISRLRAFARKSTLEMAHSRERHA
jgi:hypothetical protein